MSSGNFNNQDVDLTDLITTSQNLVRVMASILNVLSAGIPQITGTSSSATGGAATLPANPVGFITITLQNGTAAKVPYYS